MDFRSKNRTIRIDDHDFYGKSNFFYSFNIYITTGNCHWLVNLTLKNGRFGLEVANNHEFSLNRSNRSLSRIPMIGTSFYTTNFIVWDEGFGMRGGKP
jgi:hypothetical protein